MVYETTAQAFMIAANEFINITDYNIPHIINCVEVYNSLKDEPEYVQAAGILHDITFRTDITAYKLYEYEIPEETLELIDLVTPKQTLIDYSPRVFESIYAMKICMANIKYHMDLTNFGYLGESDIKLIAKFSNIYQIFKFEFNKLNESNNSWF